MPRRNAKGRFVKSAKNHGRKKHHAKHAHKRHHHRKGLHLPLL